MPGSSTTCLQGSLLSQVELQIPPPGHSGPFLSFLPAGDSCSPPPPTAGSVSPCMTSLRKAFLSTSQIPPLPEHLPPSKWVHFGPFEWLYIFFRVLPHHLLLLSSPCLYLALFPSPASVPCPIIQALANGIGRKPWSSLGRGPKPGSVSGAHQDL